MQEKKREKVGLNPALSNNIYTRGGEGHFEKLVADDGDRALGLVE